MLLLLLKSLEMIVDVNVIIIVNNFWIKLANDCSYSDSS